MTITVDLQSDRFEQVFLKVRGFSRSDVTLTPGRLLPLPVLGVPGWADNVDPAYYDDPAVFRRKRSRRDGPNDQSLRG